MLDIVYENVKDNYVLSLKYLNNQGSLEIWHTSILCAKKCLASFEEEKWKFSDYVHEL